MRRKNDHATTRGGDRRPPGRVWPASVLAGLLSIGGCETLDDLAPPVSAGVLGLATAEGVSPEQLERGRRVYITACARCHSPEPVVRYSAERWREILPRMADRSGLSPEDSGELEAYVMLTLREQGR